MDQFTNSSLSSWDNSRYAGLAPLQTTRQIKAAQYAQSADRRWSTITLAVVAGIAVYVLVSK